MNLDDLLFTIARGIPAEAPGTDLTEQVRRVLVAAITGQPIAEAPLAVADGVQRLVRALGLASADVLYEQALNRRVVVDSAGVRVVRERSEHRSSGAYYTGDPIVRYMCARARQYMPGATAAIDPACGGGAFLFGLAREFGHQVRDLVGMDIDGGALAICRSAVPTARLCHQDALLDEHSGDYDICIGNPPYISSGLRGAGPQSPDRAQKLRSRFPDAAQYKLNTYPLFVERALELVREEGLIGFILPDSFLTGRYFAGLRSLLLRHTILEITLIRKDFWQHGRVGQSVILFVRKGVSLAGHRACVRVCQQAKDLPLTEGEHLPVSDLIWGSSQRVRLITSAADREFVRTLENGGEREHLGQWLKTYSGLIARAGQESLLASHNADRPGPWGRLLRSGREIDRYSLHWAGEHVCLQPDLIKSGGKLDLYRQPKLLLRQTADALRATFDDKGYFCLNNIHLLIPRRSETDLRYLLGVINSDPVNHYYGLVAMETGRLYPQVDLDLLESIPLPAAPMAAASTLGALALARENAAPHEAALLDRKIGESVRSLYGLV